MLNSYEETYLRKAKAPLWWLNKSSDLHASAGAVWLAMKEEKNSIITQKLGLSRNFSMSVACWSVYLMLFGMSLELLFKAISVASKNEPQHSHMLEQLAEKSEIDFKESEYNILKMLTEYIVWDGRYPVPKRKKMFEQHIRHQPDFFHGESDSSRFRTPKNTDAFDWEKLNLIWNKAHSKFFDLYDGS